MKHFLLALVLLPSLCFALDYSEFNLTEQQLNLLDRLEQRGFTEEQLLNAAATFERQNNRRPTYIPAHTRADLEAVSHWAQGGAFASFADFAGVEFSTDAYKADCPNWELFNFGRATGAEHLRFDILAQTYSLAGSLQMMYAHHPETFSEEYLKLARERGFLKYLKIADEH